MKTEVVAHHTILPEFLTGGPVLDVGCRAHGFGVWFADRGHKVMALDPDPDLDPPTHPNIQYHRAALMPEGGVHRFWMHENPEARCVLFGGEVRPGKIVEVKAMGLGDIATTKWDVVKFNCEGSEYEVLPKWPGPIARQMVVSFHEHYRPQGWRAIGKIVEHLLKWYHPVIHGWDVRHYGGYNYWDSVFVLKELL